MGTQGRNEFQEQKRGLIEANRAYWAGKSNIPRGDRWIYVYHSLPHEFEYSVHEDIVAKGLQEKEKLPVTVITDGHGDELLDDLDASFGFGKSRHVFYGKFESADSEARANAEARRLASATYGDKDKLFGMAYRGVDCGDILHDEILRKSRGEAFDCFDIGEEQYFKCVRNVISMIDKAYGIFGEQPPAYMVTSECVYLKGVFASVAGKLGAKVLVVSNDYPDTLMQILPGRRLFKELKLSELLRKQIEANLEREPLEAAGGGEDLFVYGGGEQETGGLLEELGITNGNKNVFILLHVFTDCPRSGYHHHFYREYNEWFLDTLRIIKGIPDVNWIIKDHPMGPSYGQCGYVRAKFLEQEAPNLYWCDKDVSGMRVKKVADCIITCVGEAALEYWAYGIPTITVSTAYFSGWGISHNMKTLEQYEAALKNIGGLEKPAEESMEQARKSLLALKRMKNSPDELARLFLEVRRVQLESYKSGGSRSHVGIFCQKYRDLLGKLDIGSSTVYRLENVYDV